MATLGFVVLFAVVGAVFAASGRALGSYFPIGGLAVGVALAGLGLWMILTGRSVGLAGAGRAMSGVRLRGDLRSLFVFGVGYGVASLACTLPVFLVVVGTTLAVGGLGNAFAQFVGYAAGMGTMLTAVILGAAFFRSAVAGSLRRIVPYMHLLAASLLLGAGIFIVDYWLGPGGIFG
jgi:cytochrome c biogenesis protein CcdA